LSPNLFKEQNPTFSLYIRPHKSQRIFRAGDLFFSAAIWMSECGRLLEIAFIVARLPIGQQRNSVEIEGWSGDSIACQDG
jgi:hypothetical protein